VQCVFCIRKQKVRHTFPVSFKAQTFGLHGKSAIQTECAEKNLRVSEFVLKKKKKRSTIVPTKFHNPTSNGSSVITVKLKAKLIFLHYRHVIVLQLKKHGLIQP
jgi:hypothetical protein